ncbi:hypothetical protein GALMADRAFT_721268 [Galerina marginata CBS 339.88]|uniref:Uncharacterized protein n=1 Tax=Galerina marginata (strain CBS 339.88) TaxID=685588 RepID=A0A067SST2_GALM3|nr:hypothetical protein GALMADRAFT_721268 [Galerina marginata CBS 339.88]
MCGKFNWKCSFRVVYKEVVHLISYLVCGFAGQGDLGEDMIGRVQKRQFKSPPLSHLHSSFVPPPGYEAKAITEMESNLMDLEDYARMVQKKLQQHRAVMSPVRRLPPEILGEIFSRASCAQGHGMRLPFCYDMPWVLGEVCSYWRTVLLSLPKLWSEIYLDLRQLWDPQDDNTHPDIVARRVDKVRDFLETCLTRSGNELLRFFISARSKRFIDPILSTLVKHAERWAEAQINVNCLSQCHPHLIRAKNRVPNLYCLGIECYFKEHAPPSSPCDAFENAPKLETLLMEGMTYPMNMFPVPWSQVAYLQLSYCQVRKDQFRQILHSATNLISLLAEGGHRQEMPGDTGQMLPAVLPNLQYLSMVGTSGYIAEICKSLTVPNLQHFGIKALTPFPVHDTISMITRSQCKPTELTFHTSLDPSAKWERFGIAELFNELPSLTFLDLIVSNATKDLIPNFWYDDCNFDEFEPPLLPNLEKLVLEDRLCSSIKTVLETMLTRSRDNTRSPEGWTRLKSATLRIAVEDPTLSLWAKAKENGIDIVVPEIPVK